MATTFASAIRFALCSSLAFIPRRRKTPTRSSYLTIVSSKFDALRLSLDQWDELLT
jgi:hypothetical protein